MKNRTAVPSGALLKRRLREDITWDFPFQQTDVE
jgi:hypothetical protein